MKSRFGTFELTKVNMFGQSATEIFQRKHQHLRIKNQCLVLSLAQFFYFTHLFPFGPKLRFIQTK